MIRFIALLLILLPGLALAHDGRPVLIDIQMQADGGTVLSWKAPPVLAPGEEPRVELNCKILAQPTNGLQGRGLYQCEGDVTGKIIWPVANPALSSLVTWQLSNGPHDIEGNQLHGPDITNFAIGKEATGDLLAFVQSGIRHILIGYDHLLFLALMILIVLASGKAGQIKRLALMITGFTIAHSITLGLAVFGALSLPTAPVEAAIALSIVILAYELWRGPSDAVTWRWPVLVASLMGLLHGLGFASVLMDAGLPQADRGWALFGFNIGVEIGQLLFLVVMLLIWRVTGSRLVPVTAGVGGILASAWTIERVLSF